MRFRSCDGLYLPEPPEQRWDAPEGAFWWQEGTSWHGDPERGSWTELWSMMPCGSGLCAIPIRGTSSNPDDPEPWVPREGATKSDRASWQWDGQRERPTLSPSILRFDVWHGYLRAGRWEACE